MSRVISRILHREMPLQFENASHLKKDRAHWGHQILLGAHLILTMCGTSPRQIVPDFHYKLDVLLTFYCEILDTFFCTNLNENHFIFQLWFVGFFVNGNHVLHFNLCSVISIFNLFKLVMIYLCDNVLSWGDYYQTFPTIRTTDL